METREPMKQIVDPMPETNNVKQPEAQPHQGTLSKTVTITISSRITDTAGINVPGTDEIVEGFEASRNLCEIRRAIKASRTIIDAGDARDAIRVNVAFNFTDNDNHPKLVEGSYAEVMEWLDANILTPATAMQLVQHVCIRLIETSDMKCGVVTLLFEDNKVGGLGLFNELLPVELGSAIAFMSAATGQLDMYKHGLSTKGLNIPDAAEKGRIIIPGK